jgi:hypothetical protein
MKLPRFRRHPTISLFGPVARRRSWRRSSNRRPIRNWVAQADHGYYAWVKRPVCARALMDTALAAEIRAAHPASKGAYGAPRLQIVRKPAFVSVTNVWPG